MRARIHPDKEAEVRALAAAGISPHHISRITGVSSSAIRRVTGRQLATPPLCDCGRPAAAAGQPITRNSRLANGCARCTRLEAVRTADKTAGTALRPVADQPELSEQFLARINAACDAFFARRGIRPFVSSHFIHTT